MDPVLLLKCLVLVIGFYMAWNIGANDVSNAMGTSVGSGALTLRRAVLIAAFLEFGGAFLLGSRVSTTMQNGLLNISVFDANQSILLYGMCAALLGTGVWLQIASYFGWPVSTTHAIVGSIVGFGCVVGGFGAVQWSEVGLVASSWVLSPLLSGLVAYIIFYILQRNIFSSRNPIKATKRIYPILIFIFLATVSSSLIFDNSRTGYDSMSMNQEALLVLAISTVGALITKVIMNRISPPKEYTQTEGLYHPANVAALYKSVRYMRRVRLGNGEEAQEILKLMRDVKSLADKVRDKTDVRKPSTDYEFVEKLFIALQVMSACFIAFAHGANDVANAIGPVAAVLHIIDTGSLSESTAVPSWLLALGGLGIVIGLATWGWRVIETIGKKITELTPSRGFCAEFGAATTILFASRLGLPISTTHCLVGAVLGVGLAHGLKALNLRAVRDIVLSWIVTIPASALIGVIFFYILRALLK